LIEVKAWPERASMRWRIRLRGDGVDGLMVSVPSVRSLSGTVRLPLHDARSRPCDESCFLDQREGESAFNDWPMREGERAARRLEKRARDGPLPGRSASLGASTSSGRRDSGALSDSPFPGRRGGDSFAS